MDEKLKSIEPQFVENMPEKLEDGILYISYKYKVAIHNCCCGCKNKVVTQFSAIEPHWDLTVRAEFNLIPIRRDLTSPSASSIVVAAKST